MMFSGVKPQASRPADPMLPLRYRVRSVRPELRHTVTLEVEPEDGKGIAPFAPGQFNMLYAFGVGEVPISISGDPAQETLRHTIRLVGMVTKALGEMRPGEALGIRGPFGVPWPITEAAGKDILIIAGGLGFAALRSAVYRLLAERERFGRISLLYGARSPEDILFQKEIEEWRGSLDAAEVTVDHAPPGWPGNVGVVPALISKIPFDPSRTVALICGPEVMMRFTVMELMRRGVEPQHVYLSLERNMKCAVGLCGRCQFGPVFVCKDGPVFPFSQVERFLAIREA